MTQNEFAKKMDECSTVITHAGTGVIVNAVKKEKKVIAVPRLAKYKEHVDDHQIQLVKEFDELNFIEPVYEIEDLEKAIINSRNKTYNKYISNTDTIISSIEEFIKE
jgi:UDP-N-acetylglucosamine transferase subunit ALG13